MSKQFMWVLTTLNIWAFVFCSRRGGDPFCNLDSFLFESQTKPKFIQSEGKKRRSPPLEKESGDGELESCLGYRMVPGKLEFLSWSS